MNIWLSLDNVENMNVDAIKSKLTALTDLSGLEYDYYFKIYPGSIGTKVVFVCEALNIEKDITNYNNW
jgi:hypothetical protein